MGRDRASANEFVQDLVISDITALCSNTTFWGLNQAFVVGVRNLEDRRSILNRITAGEVGSSLLRRMSV